MPGTDRASGLTKLQKRPNLLGLAVFLYYLADRHK